MKPRTAARLAWTLFALTAALLAFALVVAMGSTPTFKPLSIQVQVWAIALLGVAFLAFSAVGALVATRSPTNNVGWLFLSLGASVNLALASIAYVETMLPARPWAEWVSDASSVAAFPLIAFVLLLFPDGKLPSPKWRVVAWAGTLTAMAFIVGTFTPYSPPDRMFSNPIGIETLRGTILEEGALAWALLPVTMLGAVASFVVRFRGSAGQPRQQLKWFALAAGLVAAGFLTWLAAWGAVAWSVLPETWDTILTAVGIVVFVVCLMTLPVASGIAILRHRLYDIDVIINHTLVYGALTAVLSLVYVGGVVGIGGLVRDASGQQDNNVVTAATTLVVAALFRPARARIQGFIDRRFYRQRYDAAQTIETFSARLRDEIDLETLSTELVAVVDDLMQPTNVSLWLR
ncbi:hypothetical protein BH24ACT26_BH24ACT26_01910 [soil metagenome]